jgi:hypothetical protein
MDGENGVDACALGAVENFFYSDGVEVEGDGIDVSQLCGGSGAEDGADGGEEAEGGGNDGMAGAYAGCGKREPEGVSARGAADGVGRAQMRFRGSLEDGNLFTQNELAGFEDMADSFEKFVVEGLILALEVQHGDGLGG